MTQFSGEVAPEGAKIEGDVGRGAEEDANRETARQPQAAVEERPAADQVGGEHGAPGPAARIVGGGGEAGTEGRQDGGLEPRALGQAPGGGGCRGGARTR